MGGLTAIGATIGETAIKDGYDALKALLTRKFGGAHPRLTERLDDYVHDPDTFAKPLEKTLRESGAAQDPDVVDQVTALVQQADVITPVPATLIGELKAVRSNLAVVAGNVYGGVSFGSTPTRQG
jgi:hypothetical protein